MIEMKQTQIENMGEITKLVYDKLSQCDISKAPEKLAVQVNLNGAKTGVFYIEFKSGHLSVEPYEYIDRDGEINITKTNLEKLVKGKMSFSDDKILKSGDNSKLNILGSFFS